MSGTVSTQDTFVFSDTFVFFVVSDTSPLPDNAWPLSYAVQRTWYHSEMVTAANTKNQIFEAAFHLQRMALAKTEMADENKKGTFYLFVKAQCPLLQAPPPNLATESIPPSKLVRWGGVGY